MMSGDGGASNEIYSGDSLVSSATVPDDYSSQIRRLREYMGKTQEDFAHELGVTFATVNRWENRKAVPSRLAFKIIQQVAEKIEKDSRRH